MRAIPISQLQDRIIKRFLICFFVSSLILFSGLVASDFNHEVAANSIVEVRFHEGGRQTVIASGTVISADGALLVPFYLLNEGGRITVVDPTSGAEITARITAVDEQRNLTLLKAQGLSAPPLTFSLAPLVAGIRVFSVARKSAGDGTAVAEETRGAIGRAEVSPPKFPDIGYFTHNAMISADGYGGPVLNECGEIIGINLPDPGLTERRMRRNDDPAGEVHAEQFLVVATWLRARSIDFTQAVTECVPDVMVAQTEAQQANEAFQAARTEAEEAQAAADDASQKATQAEALAETLKEKAAAASEESVEERRLREEAEIAAAAARDEATRVGQLADETAREAEEARIAAVAETEAAQAQAEAARTQAEAAGAETEAAVAEAARLQEQLQENTRVNRERMKLIAIVAGSGLLLIALAIFWRARRSRGLIMDAEQRASISANEAQQAIQAATKPPPRFNDCLLEGQGTGGKPVAVRVSGADLAQRSEGLVIGRHLGQAQIIINDPDISRRHARLQLQANQLTIEDLGSTNGTSVNGRRGAPGQPMPVTAGDSIDLGTVKVRLVYV